MTETNFMAKIKNGILNKKENQSVECPICDMQIKAYWESRYNGIRATCPTCEINWAES
jgi:hypothetical protein